MKFGNKFEIGLLELVILGMIVIAIIRALKGGG